MAKAFEMNHSTLSHQMKDQPACPVEEKIIEIYIDFKGKIGSPLMKQELLDHGMDVNMKKVKRLMRKNGLLCQYSRKKTYKLVDFGEDLLKMDFNTDQKDKVWVSDITELTAKNQKLYLCIILDLFSRKIVNWKCRDNIRQELVQDTIEEAIKERKPEEGLIFHSDKGTQYTARKTQEIITSKKFLQSISKGGCYGNAVAESFFSILKRELGSTFKSKEDCISGLNLWIEGKYNNRRKHSSLGYKTPNQVDTAA